MGTQLEQLADVENLQMEMPPVIELAYMFSAGLRAASGHTFGGMSVESARRVMKLILITVHPRQPN